MPQSNMTLQLAPNHPDGLTLRNPIIIASGTFGLDGFGSGLPKGIKFQNIGAVVAKTVTKSPRKGNETPRMLHGAGWLLNSIGLENPGIEVVLKKFAPRWAMWEVPVILSIAGECLEDFAYLAGAADRVPGIAALEVNVSCPNIEGGLEFGQSPELTESVTRLVRESTQLPVIVKLSPNVADIVEIARASERGGAHALCLTNTLRGIAVDHHAKSPVLGGIIGGVSGPALKPVALGMVYSVYREVNLPLIGVGGISSVGDVLQYLMAGACAIQIGSASYADPWNPLNVLSGLQRYMRRENLDSLAELVGSAQTS